MSSAYCLTCNEQVTETPVGTCPEGHPVSSHDEGPQPWVGHAGSDGAVAASTERRFRPVDVAELQDPPFTATASDGAPANGPRANGTPANGTTADGTRAHDAGSGGTGADGAPVDRQPANGAASDDLAAMLAEALASHEEATADRDHVAGPAPEPTPDPSQMPDPARDTDPVPVDREPVPGSDPAPAEPPPGTTEPSGDWDELATLAAELQLDDEGNGREEPAASAAPADDAHPPADHDPASHHDPGTGQATAGSAARDLADALGLDLDADAEPDDPGITTPPPGDVGTGPGATPPPPQPPAPSGAVPAPPPPPAAAPSEPASSMPWDELFDGEEPTAAPAPDGGTDPQEVPTDDPAGEPTPVDLTNFTARGRRVGDGSVLPGATAPRKSWFRRRP